MQLWFTCPPWTCKDNIPSCLSVESSPLLASSANSESLWAASVGKSKVIFTLFQGSHLTTFISSAWFWFRSWVVGHWHIWKVTKKKDQNVIMCLWCIMNLSRDCVFLLNSSSGVSKLGISYWTIFIEAIK